MARLSSSLVPMAIAVVAGILAWDLVRLIGDRREAWDDPSYWLLGYPLMLFTAFILGLGFPERPWRWALTIVGAQAAWSVLLSMVAAGAPNLLPMGLFLFALLSLPLIGAACAGGRLGQRPAG